MKVFVEFDSVEQAAVAVAAVSQASAPAQQFAPAPQAPVSQFAQPQQFAPTLPQQQFAQPAPQQFAPQQQQFTPAAVPQQAAPVAQVTLKELTVAGQNFAKKYGAPQAKAVMAQFGVQKMADCPPQNMAALLAALSV